MTGTVRIDEPPGLWVEVAVFVLVALAVVAFVCGGPRRLLTADLPDTGEEP